jgi:hypothetical protein
MTTDKQIAANRLNAQKNTGPRTQVGKQRSIAVVRFWDMACSCLLVSLASMT